MSSRAAAILLVVGLVAPGWSFPIVQQAYLKASNSEFGDQFGSAVAVSGNTVVVGAWMEDSGATGVDGNANSNTATNAGAAFVFVRDSNGVWTQQAYLKASNTGAEDSFGRAVAIFGDTIVVGAPFEDSSATGINGDQSSNGTNRSGAVYVFVRDANGVWSQQAYIKASNTGAGDEFGAVALWGDTLVVGAHVEDSNAVGVNGDQGNNGTFDSGAVYVFVRDAGGGWSQQAYIKASNTGAFDSFGQAVALAGDTLVVGAPFEDSNATGVNGNQASNSASTSGAAYVFVRNGGVWSQQAYLKASNTNSDDVFGKAVAVAGDTVFVGAPQEDSSATGFNGNQSDNSLFDTGAAYIFARDAGGAWSQQAYVKASNTGDEDNFGFDVAMSGDTAVIGAPFEDSSAALVDGDQHNNGAFNAGAAYVFVRGAGGAWSQQGYLKASNTGSFDTFGDQAAVSGGTVVIGAFGEDSIATGVDGDQFDNSGLYAGAAYVFDGAGTPAQRGDLNCDDTINFFDIDPFLLALFDEAGYAAAWPECSRLNADINLDGDVNFFDIDPFLECLFAVCP